MEAVYHLFGKPLWNILYSKYHIFSGLVSRLTTLRRVRSLTRDSKRSLLDLLVNYGIVSKILFESQ